MMDTELRGEIAHVMYLCWRAMSYIPDGSGLKTAMCAASNKFEARLKAVPMVKGKKPLPLQVVSKGFV